MKQKTGPQVHSMTFLKNFEISIKTKAAFAQQQLWNHEWEKKNKSPGSKPVPTVHQHLPKTLKSQSMLKQPWPSKVRILSKAPNRL
jgi:hypothetical protein